MVLEDLLCHLMLGEKKVELEYLAFSKRPKTEKKISDRTLLLFNVSHYKLLKLIDQKSKPHKQNINFL